MSGAHIPRTDGFTFAPGRTQYELTSWITLNRPAIDVPAHGSSQVRATGKTTLAHGFDYVADDHLILYRDDQEDGGGLVATGLPTTIRVGIGTYLSMEDVLPPPWARHRGRTVRGWLR
ncbi:hypothetical protein [Microbispora hainanensis]|uniref:hypothetical protein n=1 Tax=Microbispora hainanensis TaxID=568844 RepID=UPI0033FC816B